jgi:membrane dipeptidase
LVGINFATCFLREDGRINADTPMETVVRHADYLIDKLGIEGVGFGSDFDGAVIPQELEDAQGLPKLIAAFRSAGYDDATLELLCAENWLRMLERTWAAKA